MRFDFLSNVFSKRSQSPVMGTKPLTIEFKNRVVMLCRDSQGYGGWDELHKKLTYLHGRPILTNNQYADVTEDTIDFLFKCSDEDFLDFIELTFQTRMLDYDRVDTLNEFLRLDDLPYTITKEVWEEETNGYHRSYRLVRFPQVIRRDNDFLHTTATEPVLKLLTAPVFASAEREFMKAHKHYRNGEYDDCLTDCASALESVMKIICELNGWHYTQDDTARKLLNTIFENNDLANFFKEPIGLIATIRNKVGSAHGAGSEQRNTSEHIAQFALNATASSILLLTVHCLNAQDYGLQERNARQKSFLPFGDS